MADKADGSVDFAQLQVRFLRESDNHVHPVGDSPIFKTLLQTEVRASLIVFPPALTNSAGMYSTPADFPIFSASTAAYTSSRRTGRDSSSGIYAQSSTFGSPLVS